MHMTTRFLSVFLLLSFCLPVFASPVFGQSNSPQAALADLLAKLKSEGDLSPLIKVIDWQRHFEAMSLEERKALGFSSAEDIKEYYRQRAEANGDDVLVRLLENDKKYTSGRDNSATARQVLAKTDLRKQQEDLKKLIRGTKVVVKASEIRDSKAVLKIQKTVEGNSEEVELHMHNRDGAWLLESAAVLNPLSRGKSTSSPIGSLPDPTRVLAMP